MLPAAEIVTLNNGLRLVLVHDSGAESVVFAMFAACGSRHEPKNRAGISHFIEHMLFKGTATRTLRDINRAVEGRGGTFNACTNEESTCYYAVMPYTETETAIDVISDMYLNAAFPESEFEREREVIIQEIMMYDDDPESVASENLSKILFPGNPLGLPVAGTPDVLRKFTADDLRKYKNKAYSPKATVAVLAGNFDRAKVEAFVEKRLGGFRGARPLAYKKFEASGRAEKEITVTRDIQQMQLAMGWRTPFGWSGERKFALTLLDAILGRGMSSRLFEAVREKRGLSYDIHTSTQLFAETGALTVCAGLDASRETAAVKAIMAEIEKLRRRKVPDSELRRVKDFITGLTRISLERQTARVFYYGPLVLSGLDLMSPQEQLARIEAVSSAEILSLAEELLAPENAFVSRVLPKSRGGK